MSIAATIREKLMIALRPTRLDVINESHVHAGHQSSPGTGESHFRVLVMSPERSVSIFAGIPNPVWECIQAFAIDQTE